MKDLTKLTINFLGDSITEGAWATEPKYNYVSRVGEKLGCKTNNYGISGTRIAMQTIPSANPVFDKDFLTRAKEMSSADLVFVFGGTNDYGHGDSEIGELTSSDSHTFCGAVRNLANYLCNRYGKRNVCFILPLHRYDEDNPRGEFGSQTKLRPSLKEYVKAEIAVLDDMDVRYLDFRNAFPLPVTNTPTEYFQDGLHPTNKGHELLAALIADYVRKNYQ